MKKTIIFILLSLLMLGAMGYFYVNKFLLPVKLKEIVATKSLETLHRKVHFDSVNYRFLKGFDINNIIVYQKDNPQRKFIHIEKLSFNVLLLPFLKEHKIIVPYIHITKPFVNVIRHQNGEWNFNDLITSKSSSSSPAPLILPANIKIKNATLLFDDFTNSDPLQETLTQLSAEASLSLNKGIQFQMSFKLPEYDSQVISKGHYALTNKNLQAQLQMKNIPIASLFKRYINNPRLDIKNGYIQDSSLSLSWQSQTLTATGKMTFIDPHLIIDNDKTLKSATAQFQPITMGWKNNRLNLKGSFMLKDGYFKTPTGEEITGNLSAEILNLRYLSQNLSLNGNVNLRNGQIRINEKILLTGDFIAPNLALIKKEAVYQIKGNWKFNKGHLNSNGRMYSSDVQAEDFSLLKHATGLALRGSILLQNALLNFSPQLKIAGNIDMKETHLTFKNQILEIKSPLDLKNGNIALSSGRNIQGDILSPDLHLKHTQEKTQLNGEFSLNQATFNIGPHSKLTGSPTVLVKLTNQRTSPDTSILNYTGFINFKNAAITGLPKIDTITNLSGRLNYDNQKIDTNSLSFQYNNNQWLLSGSSSGFGAPFVDVKLKTQKTNIEHLLSFFPQLKKQYGISASGMSKLTLDYKGHLDQFADADITVQADILEGQFKSDSLLSPFSNVAGQLIYKKDDLRWNNLSFHYKNKNYSSSGKLINFTRPHMVAKLTGDHLTADIDLNILNKVLQFTSLSGKYFNTTFDVASDVSFIQNLQPDFYVKGDVILDLSDLENFMPSLSSKIKPLDLKGQLKLKELLFKGNLTDWRKWDFTFNGASPRVLIKGIPLSSLTLAYGQRDQHISQMKLQADIYNGALNLDGKADLRTNQILSRINGSLNKLDLAVLTKEQELKKKDLSGIVDAAVSLQGDLLKPRSMTGEGLLNIRDGFLWQWKILNGLFSALLIPEFKQTAFTEARVPFNIKDGKIITEQTQITGKALDLLAHGWIDMNREINFVIIPKFSEIQFLQSSSTLKKIPSSLFTQTKGYISIDVTGTIHEPKYKVQTFPGKILEKTTIFLKEGIQGIFEEIF